LRRGPNPRTNRFMNGLAATERHLVGNIEEADVAEVG